MSWSSSFTKPVVKAAVSAELDNLVKPSEPEMVDQFQVAKTAVRILLQNIAGPFIIVTMSGHANGVGWHKKEGWASDCINVSVLQVSEEDYKVSEEDYKQYYEGK